MLTWQLPHGGFYKNDVTVYAAAWNGSDRRSGWTGAGGVELGTIDNNATVTELLFLADVYQRSGDTK
jgi:PelA/Pel-15E family pectate lyase